MHSQMESQHYLYKPRTHVRERPLHWFIMFISYLFIFLLVLESIAFIILGAWHLAIPRLENVLTFSGAIYRRELGFGILLVIIGAFGILISIIGIVATIILRISILKIYASFLWCLLILGIIVGIIGIIFASQVDGFLNNDLINHPNLIAKNYYEEKFLLGMNGGLTLFMSLTMLVGIIIIHCLANDVDYYSNDYFIEVTPSTENQLLPSVVILDDEHNPTIINSSSSSSIYTYHLESSENTFGIATRINRTFSDSNLLYAIIQISNNSFYDIIPTLNNDYIVKHKGSIIEQAYISIKWHNTRKRRAIKKSKSPKKSRHIYLEIIAVIDSLILNDVRTLLNKTEFETIEILKLYYIHLFIGVEQLYQQSLIYETLDIHIRLLKIIFSTDKYRLPWESYKNISSLTNIYRKSPNNLYLRPNISMNLLKSLHQSYTSNKFDRLFSKNIPDHIMTFTRLDLIDGSGSAFVSGLCLPLYKYSIIQEDLNSYSMMITVTHELGHNLGLNHDEIENKCNDPHIRYIMSPKNINTLNRRQVTYFSKCSIQQLNFFADKTTTKCWKNKIISTKLSNIISNKLGQIINLRQQCQLQYGLQAIPFINVVYNKSQTLYEESICNQLRCFKKPFDNLIHWLDGAFDGTPCGENRICYQKKCISTKEKIKRNKLAICPYGDLSIPVSMLNLNDKMIKGNMLCPDALNLLRARGMNITYLCYNSILPYGRLCCEECKKHLIPECGDLHSKCSTFAKYCQMKFVRVDGRPATELCPYTCGKCPHLLPSPISPTKTTTVQMFTKKGRKNVPVKPRKYIKPKKFTQYTCIDMADCSQLIKFYSKLNKNVTNWCKEYSKMIKGRYFVEMCPKYCSLCNITSECDRYKLCRNNGKCIRNEYGTYQCICSSSKTSYGTLCEYRRTCLNKSCSSKNEYCIQTQGENYVCLSKEDKEQMRIILNSTYKKSF